MNLQEYQKLTRKTAIYPQRVAEEYLIQGLTSEAGEVAGVRKKYLRDGLSREEYIAKLEAEMGDVFWYLVSLAYELKIPLHNILAGNIEKLKARQQNNTLKGDGDDR